MRRSISARIFAGFLLVVLVFAAVMGFTFYRMQEVGRQLDLINSSYLRLTQSSSELYIIQRNMLYWVAERSAGRGRSRFIQTQVRAARRYRLQQLEHALNVVTRTQKSQLGEHDQLFFHRTQKLLTKLKSTFEKNEAPFEKLFSDLSEKEAEREDVGESLFKDENALVGTIRRVRGSLNGRVKAVGLQIEEDQRYVVWAGLALVLALLISLIVTYRARQMLRPLKVLVEGTKRIGSGDYAERVTINSNDELGLLAGEFNSMAAAVEEREQRLIRSERLATAGRLASHITHEVRNPLSSISLNAEMLAEELEGLPTEKSDEALTLCREIHREVDRLTEITEEYLRFARLPKPHLEAEQLNDVLSSLISFISKEMKQRNVELVAELESGLPTIQADENQLRQAFLNLLRNAGESMGEAGGKVIIRTAKHDGSIRVEIADQGEGISAENLAQIFEPFFSTKRHGTGLGLALTQQIFDEHGGSIRVVSKIGEGTTFVVELPTASAVRDRSTPA